MKFTILNPRYASAPIDDDRAHGLLALNSTTSTSNSQALAISGFYLSGIGALATAIVDSSGAQITNFGAPSPLFAVITASTTGVTNLVAAQIGKQIRVLQALLVSNGAVNVKFQSHTTPTDLTGLLYLVANTGFSTGFSPVGQFQTTIGEALDINLSGNIAVGGFLTYTLI